MKNSYSLIHGVHKPQVEGLCRFMQGKNFRLRSDGSISFEVDYIGATDIEALQKHMNIFPLQFWTAAPNLTEPGIIITIKEID